MSHIRLRVFMTFLIAFLVMNLMLTSLVVAFDFSICDTPEQAIQELGDDYYAFCESNVEPAYYSNSPDVIASQVTDQTIFSPEAPPVVTHSDNFSSEPLEPSLNKATLIGGVLGFTLLIFFLVLVLFHYRHQRHFNSEAIAKLLPVARQYQQAGYTPEQIEVVLSERGYEKSFINKLLKALELKP